MGVVLQLLECEEAETACAVVQGLASESNRYSGRKERTQQRSSFRDFSQAMEVSGDVCGRG